MAAVVESSIAYFCPRCGSPSVDFGKLTGSSACCKACGWTGVNSQLMQHAFKQEHGTDERIIQDMMNDFRKMYGTHGTLLAVFLQKWGFLTTLDAALLTRYIAAMAGASLRAVFEVRQELEKERVNGGS